MVRIKHMGTQEKKRKVADTTLQHEQADPTGIPADLVTLDKPKLTEPPILQPKPTPPPGVAAQSKSDPSVKLSA